VSAPTAAVTPAQSTPPWKKPSALQDKQGINAAFFGYPGAGKTTLAASGPKPLVIDVDGTAVRSLADRNDIEIMPIRNWDDIEKISQYLKTRSHPFETISWDTCTAMQKMALQKVTKTSATPTMPSQGEYGTANEMVLTVVRDWCALARETGVHVIFNVHAEEVKDENSGVVLVRMSLTPGTLKGVNQATDTIGYLQLVPGSDKRKLLLRTTARIIAKHHQPQTGKRLAHELDDPTLQMFIDQARAVNAGGK
jgi:hypothetical protein